jgi:hypothetical protein
MRRVRRADNLATFMRRSVMKSGSLNLLEPSGPVQPCTGVALPLPFTHLWLRFPPIILSAIHAYRYFLNLGWHYELTMSLKDWRTSGWNTRWHCIFRPTSCILSHSFPDAFWNNFSNRSQIYPSKFSPTSHSGFTSCLLWHYIILPLTPCHWNIYEQLNQVLIYLSLFGWRNYLAVIFGRKWFQCRLHLQVKKWELLE